jgi:dUTP pyrophosphatase
MNLRVCKIRSEAKLPTRAYESDAGMDIYYCPSDKNSPSSMAEEGYPVLPRQSATMSTGIKVEVPYGHMLEIKNKSGIASKRQLIIGACVVDPGYNGELFVNLHNIGLNTQYIYPGDKIAQAVLVPVVHCGIEEAHEDDLNANTLRGEGGFGSTGSR